MVGKWRGKTEEYQNHWQGRTTSYNAGLLHGRPYIFRLWPILFRPGRARRGTGIAACGRNRTAYRQSGRPPGSTGWGCSSATPTNIGTAGFSPRHHLTNKAAWRSLMRTSRPGTDTAGASCVPAGVHWRVLGSLWIGRNRHHESGGRAVRRSAWRLDDRFV